MTAHLLIFTLSALFFGVFGADDVVRLSAMEGESVTLHINPDKIHKATDLLWLYNGERKVLAKIDREAHTSSIPGNDDERFRSRLKLDPQIGSLTISDVRLSDSGVYKLEMSSKSGTPYKIFNVTVIAKTETTAATSPAAHSTSAAPTVPESSQRSHWIVIGPVLVAVAVAVVVVLVVCCIKYKCFKNRDGMY